MIWNAAVVLAILLASQSGPGGPDARAVETWREPLRCGPNTLHAYLNLHDRRASLGDVDALVPVGPDGASMADLARAATTLGVPSRVVRSDPRRLGDWPLPAIAHLNVQEGHFVLVLRVAEDEVTTADLTSGEIRSMPADRFQETWSGYLVVAGDGAAKHAAITALGSLASAIGLVLLWRRPARSSGRRGGRRAAWGVAGLLAVAGIVLAAWPSPAAAHADRPAAAILILDRPVPIAPAWTREGVAAPALSADRWDAIAAKVRPDRAVPDVAHLVHQWENWAEGGPPSREPRALTAGDMEAILLDGASDDLFGVRRTLIHVDATGRPRVARYGARGSESHAHQALSSCAAMGIPSARTVVAAGSSPTVADLVRTAMDDFHLEGEPEWSAMALARYAPTRSSWTNRWGKTFRFDDVAEHFLGRPAGEGACSGTHALQALAVMLRVDAETPLFRPAVAAKVRARLEDAAARLAASQRPDGSWAPDWPHPLADPSTGLYDDLLFGPARRAQMTGHHLEWLQLLPESFALDPGRRRRAVQACVDLLERASRDEVWAELCPYSHCFRIARRYVAPNPDGREGRP